MPRPSFINSSPVFVVRLDSRNDGLMVSSVSNGHVGVAYACSAAAISDIGLSILSFEAVCKDLDSAF